MARALRVLVPGAWYHVVNRGIERRRIFYGGDYYQRFEELLERLVQQFGVNEKHTLRLAASSSRSRYS
jgi:REP element-mobilizing transposase RayT